MAPDDFPAGGHASDFLGYGAVWLVLVAVAIVFFRRTRGRKGALRLVVGNLLVLCVLSATGAIGTEAYFRYLYDETDQYGLTLTNFSWFRRHVWLNSRGYRDVEFAAAKPPGVTRVACVGDSFTLGYGVRNVRDAYPQWIGASLAARSPGRFDVRNYGEVGASTGDEARLVDQIGVADAIDHVVLGYCLNDPDDLLPADRKFDREKVVRPEWLKSSHSFAADFLWFSLHLADDPRVKGYFDWEIDAYDDPKVWGTQCDRFRRIAETCRRDGIELDVVVFPFFSDWGESYRFGTCHDRVVDAWKRLGVAAIDLRDAYRGVPAKDLVVNRRDAHPNERAHEIAARTILDRVFGVR